MSSGTGPPVSGEDLAPELGRSAVAATAPPSAGIDAATAPPSAGIDAAADGDRSAELAWPVADRLSAAVRRRLGRSLHVRHLDTGSCNGCDWEIAALLNSYHDLQRLGIDIVSSPRHADLLLVTGIMTRNLEEAARLTYEAMAEPRLVVAVGACAISGGVFAGTYAGRSGIAEVLPVDVRVPGCPPRPEALLEGLLVAVGRLPGRL